jgi:tRNA G26 N,N-dimethylase Trm1
MIFNIYLNDLNESTVEKIRERLRRNLQIEIEEAVNFGAEREMAETEIVNEYLNCHNFGVPLEL